MIKYTTGRNYGTAQILEIDAPGARDDDDMLADVRVTFNDTARHIRGVVSVMRLECDANLGRAVLREYDAGRYNEVTA